MARDPLKVLVVTGGHPFEQEPFLAIFDAVGGIAWEHEEPPRAREHFRPGRAGEFDAIVCYDMQGIVFNKPDLPRLLTPPAEYAEGFRQMLEAGQGIVFLHHAMSAWPTWPLWAEVVGGRWNYVPGELRGRSWPASGYTREVEHHISCIDPAHPICAGLEEGFDIVDEIYLNPVLEDSVVPLLRTDFDMSPESFFSGQHAIQGRLYDREGWTHPPGRGLVGWVKTAGRSPIAYLQSGHGPAAYGNAGFRRLLSNAIAWVASDEAHRWAADHETALAG
ncbi:MAG: ThuA domain-containing protein [Acidimicrobiales bacterium]|jgi:type 1 glutamine amidotransferase